MRTVRRLRWERRAGVALLLLSSLGSLSADAKVFLDTQAALEAAFPGCKVARSSVFLDQQQKEAAEKLAGVPIRSAMVYPYRASCQEKPAGTAYFDTHKVRTLPETVMVVVDGNGRVKSLEVLEFREPLEYMPRPNWYAQFHRRLLDDRLVLRRDIQGITGATLTSRSTTEAVRRVLALHQVLLDTSEVSP